MKRCFILFYLLSFCVFIQNTALSQTIRKFSKEPQKYYAELYNFMTASYEEGEAIMSEFHAIWKTDHLSPKEQEQIFKTANKAIKRRMKAQGDSVSFQYSLSSKKLSDNQIASIYNSSNSMLKKRMKPSHFSSYLLTLINFTTSEQSEKSFLGWETSLIKLIKKATSRKIIAYLDFSKNLFSANILYKSPSVVWLSNNINYSFGYDSLPKIRFKSLDLKCYSKEDSTIIYKTAGTYYPTEGVWNGKNGEVNWLRTGIGKNKIIAFLSDYSIKLKSASYTAENVTFYNKMYFKTPLKGQLMEKIKANVTIENATYPRFQSYDKRLKIDNIFKNINYVGGFSMIGAKFIGEGSKEEDAYLTIKFEYENDSINKTIDRFMVAASKKYVIESERMTSSKCAITMYLNEDSIFHPKLRLMFMVKKINNRIISRDLRLIREKEGLSQSPYFNSYHKLEMDFEGLNWDIDDPQIKFWRVRGVTTESKADFTSTNYYRNNIYQAIQGRDQYHPLVKLKQFSKQNADTREFYVNEFSGFLKLPIVDVRQQIMHLSNYGFLNYDFSEDHVYIKDKVFNYLAANAGRQDYDVITFSSNTKNEQNASLNLLNYDLNMNGVRSIFLSDSQNVYIYPTNREIIVKKNRDFVFAGQVHAGLFDFFGKEFSFEYDNFKINLTNVDSLRLSIYSEEDKFGDRKVIPIKTVIEAINGELLVDKPFNKSGVKPSPTYPIFHSFKDSYTFYERQSIQKSVYKRDSFYFHLEPFTIDSLDNFDPSSIALAGTFVSGGIFPDFKDSLTLRPDYSMGFERPTPENGYPIYGGKGQFISQINLSHEGLKGNGKLNYLNSSAISENITFLPDSLNSSAQSFVNKAQKDPVEFPDVNAEMVYIHWEPQNDEMLIYDREKPMLMYQGDGEMHGRIELKPEGMEGKGQMEIVKKAHLFSNSMKFKQNTFDADTSEFKLESDVISEFSFATDNVNAHIDFVKEKGVFKSNIGGSLVEFDPNQYICYVNEFTWDMVGGDVAMSSDNVETLVEGGEEVVLKGSKFVSMHPKQDSLYFFAAKANYDLKTKLISAEEVEFIYVADSRIYPNDGKVVIRKKAKMDPLENAKILANIITKYHEIYDANVSITGKKNYSGNGKYKYIDEEAREQIIMLNEIGVDTTIQTFGKGIITDSANFTLSPKFAFSGAVTLKASNKYLNFDGFCKISHSCEDIISHWFQLNTEINPDEIYIPIGDTTLNLTNDQLSSGLKLEKDSFSVYSTFLSPNMSEKTLPVIDANGYLFYDKGSEEYRISNKDKLIEISQPGNYISLKTKYCIVYGEGKFTFSDNIGQVKLTTVGNGQHFLKKDSILFDVILGIDFFFVDGALKVMANTITNNTDLLKMNFDRPVYERGLMELVGKEAADKFIADVNLLGAVKRFPDELEKTIVLSDLKLVWNDSSKSYLSVGPIGIGNIFKWQVNKYVTGNVELVKKRGGDILNIYLKPTEDSWFFFTYSRGLMQAVSSETEFNSAIQELKAPKRKQKVTQKGGMPYQFIISSERKKEVFLRKIQGI